MTDTVLHKGKLPAVRPYGLSDLAVYARGKLALAPPSFPAPTLKNWGMLGNDTAGDCTIAGAAHLIKADNLEMAQQDRMPTTGQCLKQYFTLSDGQDSGLAMANVLQTWRTTGLFSHNKVQAYAPVPVNSLDNLHSAIAFYGGAYIGIALPQSAEDQFGAGQPWTVVPNSPNIGGHCIVLVGYDQTYAYAITWGKLIQVAYPFLARYMDEAWAVISQELFKAKKDNLGLDLPTLLADLDAV